MFSRMFQSLARLTKAAASSIITIDSWEVFQREAVAIVFTGLAAYVSVALITFQPGEAWLYSFHVSAQLLSKNLCGTTGNAIAGALTFYLGIIAWIIPIGILQLGFELHRANLRRALRSAFVGWLLFAAAAMPIIVSLVPVFNVAGYSFSSGGAIGQLLFETLKEHTGVIGTQILLWSFACAAFLLIVRLGVADLRNLFHMKKPVSGTDQLLDNNDASMEQEQKTVQQMDASKFIEPVVQDKDRLLFRNTTPSDTVSTMLDNSGSRDSLHKNTPPEVFAGQELEPQESSPEEFAPTRPYSPPSVELFKHSDERLSSALSPKELEATGLTLTQTLADFGITGKIVGYQPGPVVTVYEYQPDAGIKQAKVLSLLDDIALALKVDSIFIHPVPGKRALGIQVPNVRRETVYLGDVLASEAFLKSPSPLTFAMGKTISGAPFCCDLTSMPHLLAAGATGTGKSVAINSLLCSIIMKSSPDDVRMILVDPKMLELSVYDGIPHLLMPVITEPDRASNALKWAANEMERRYKLMQCAQVRNIGGFNTFWDSTSEEKKTHIRSLVSDDSIGRLPYILLVIDELADLMLTAPKDVESSIQRLAQKARASGIHMVLATQRPSVDVITGVIKANLPCRLSFQVVSKHDSRTILDQVGSEKLLGKGDILLQRPGVGKLERLQGALVSDEEVLALVAGTKANYKLAYDEKAMNWIDEELTRSNSSDSSDDGVTSCDDEPKWDEAISIAKTHGVVSASFLQRHLKIGYNRAARIVEGMEAQGLVAKAEGSKPRRWLGSNP